MKTERWPYGIGWEPDSKLKPCPFCGSVGVIGEIGNEHTKSRGYDVKCSNVDCRFTRSDRVIKYSLEWLRPQTIEAWNRRFT